MSGDDDSKLFRDSVGPVIPVAVTGNRRRAGVQPSSATRRARQVAEQNSTAGGDRSSAHMHLQLSEDVLQWVEPSDVISFKRPGLQDRQIRKLRQGQYDDGAVLDLHGLTVVQARSAVANFIAQAATGGVRNVLISHGKGEGRARPALLKSWVNQWLRDIPAVLAFHSARPRHGGSGATYALVAKKTGWQGVEHMGAPRK